MREPPDSPKENDSAYSIDSLSDWVEPSESEEEPLAHEDDEEKKLSKEFELITQDDKIDITRKLGQSIDVTRYVVFTSARHNQVSVYWRKQEHRSYMVAHMRAVEEIGKIPGARAFASTRSCRISYHGLEKALSYAAQWQQWHSIFSVYRALWFLVLK